MVMEISLQNVYDKIIEDGKRGCPDAMQIWGDFFGDFGGRYGYNWEEKIPTGLVEEWLNDRDDEKKVKKWLRQMGFVRGISEEELKPCPFCGNEVVEESNHRTHNRIVCKKCSIYTGWYNKSNVLRMTWNQRQTIYPCNVSIIDIDHCGRWVKVHLNNEKETRTLEIFDEIKLVPK